MAKDQADATDYGNPATAVRCRLMATSTAATVQAESGTSWSETVHVYEDALAQTASQVGGVAASLLTGATPWLLLGLAVLLLVGMPRRR